MVDEDEDVAAVVAAIGTYVEVGVVEVDVLEGLEYVDEVVVVCNAQVSHGADVSLTKHAIPKPN